MLNIPMDRLQEGVAGARQLVSRLRLRPRPNADRQPFDLAKMQLEPIRRQKRQLLLRRSLPAVLLVACIALWFLLPTPLTGYAINNYKGQNYKAARRWLAPLTWSSPQPFVASFDAGTVDSQLAKYPQSEAELLRALAIAPANKRCMVLQNLVFTLQAHSKSLANSDTTQATYYSSQATNYMENNKQCFKIPPPPKPKPKGGGGGGGGGGEAQANQILSATQQQQLQQKNELGQQSQQLDFLQNKLNPNSPNLQPW